jgi:hypothetical protein
MSVVRGWAGVIKSKGIMGKFAYLVSWKICDPKDRIIWWVKEFLKAWREMQFLGCEKNESIPPKDKISRRGLFFREFHAGRLGALMVKF